MTGLAATRALLAVQPVVRVLAPTASPSDTVLRDAAASGARGSLRRAETRGCAGGRADDRGGRDQVAPETRP